MKRTVRLAALTIVMSLTPLISLTQPAKEASYRPPDEVEYHFTWEYKNIPFNFSLYEAPASVSSRLSETGLFEDISKLDILRPLPDHKFTILWDEKKYFYLIAENKTDREISFAVAPHLSNPVEASIGFNFACLCNGHIYKVPPKRKWYRIISLQTFKGVKSKTVILNHTVFRPPQSPKQSNSKP